MAQALQPRTKTLWGAVLAVWAAGLGAAAQYGKISVVFDRLPELYPEAGAGLSWTVSLAGVLGILLGVVAGLFVASFGFRRTLVWSLWLGAAMSLLQMLHLPFGLFLTTRLIEGLSHLGIVVAAPTLMAMLGTDDTRGLLLTIWSTFFGVSFALLSWFGLPFVASQGVLALFGLHGVIMAALAVVLGVALRNVPVPPRAPLPGLGAMPGLHLSIYRSPFKMAPAAGWLFYTCCFVAILTVLPPFVAEENRALVMGAMPLVSMGVSMTFGVALLRLMPAVRLVQLGCLLGAGAMMWLWAAEAGAVACIAVAAAFGLIQGASFASVPQLNADPSAQAEANGAMSQAGNAGNVIGTPLLVSMLAVGGFGGMALTVAVLLLSALLVHEVLAQLRRRAQRA
ncbi:Major Facilitator Superfamily protein [Tritonibacter multivorans]|uniref:Major Facilitator Superfamily protein n=1 Tax=Tritonibacter multivorans TaxID=928856 RepID=A0A0P1GIM8_9RHOB|nr:MFS transporter [Tritonibacter multivorans]MDA7420394.1 MFS transporter [Tritonibacter multivorans]CUH81682.1 Major Facilitator Superfamily protein [Tritonibacter multivorans]SFC41234.1 Predicted arabinose efflux permease, MFS family [Tritonibacter multivorans]